jgi:hypothetical protein
MFSQRFKLEDALYLRTSLGPSERIYERAWQQEESLHLYRLWIVYSHDMWRNWGRVSGRELDSEGTLFNKG